ncbi:hypothetical protein TEA_017983 [Camellia sinensis var. sinensis]|uniref:non-specific serine/threonine protein kinase n=1 Tax=Camellia sinensis var. sinensis TaxID=542762 RepID=A0A4S4F0R1_CAMSN|nr:hypothetical protein TEA_017983 [Camellia sinensis var. sinensis]
MMGQNRGERVVNGGGFENNNGRYARPLGLPQYAWPPLMDEDFDAANALNSENKYRQFESNLKGLLSGSPYNDGDQSNLSTAIKTDDPDRVYGLFLCGVDVANSFCKYCIDSASDEIVKQCPLKKEAVIWYDQCLISYSNKPFFSANETSQAFCKWQEQYNRVKESDNQLNQILGSMFDNLSIVATSNPSISMNATTNVNFSGVSMDGMVKCAPDLSPIDCRNCLSGVVSAILSCILGSWVRRFTPSCIVRYDLNHISQDPPLGAAEAPSAGTEPEILSSGSQVSTTKEGKEQRKKLAKKLKYSTWQEEDPTRDMQLDWKTRLLIINGIARGLLYLDEDSRLRIIDRDLQASNVLLDHEVNPKISYFGMGRIFGGNQSEANTNKVVETYGYMAPEYAMEGQFSIKSDVFSFGVLLLEMISGKKNSGFYVYENGHNLLTFVYS